MTCTIFDSFKKLLLGEFLQDEVVAKEAEEQFFQNISEDRTTPCPDDKYMDDIFEACEVLEI